MLLFSVHPKPKGGKVKRMNFVTLKELKKIVPAVEEGKRPPSLKKILEEGTEVVLRKLMENHAEVVVYKNEGKKTSVKLDEIVIYWKR